jgi:hypothetical protein
MPLRTADVRQNITETTSSLYGICVTTHGTRKNRERKWRTLEVIAKWEEVGRW